VDGGRTPPGAAVAVTAAAAGQNPRVLAAPRSLILDLFGDYLRYVGGEVRLAHLTALMEEFGVAPATVRMTLTRLKREDWFLTERDGRETVYRLSDRMLGVLDQGRQRIFASPRPSWDHRWTMVIYQLAETQRQERDQLRKGLAWAGFGPMTTSTWLAPGDRTGSADAATALIPGDQVDVFTCLSRGLEQDRALAQRCWDLAGLARDYDAFLASYQDAVGRPGPTGSAALVARTQLVSTFRHFPFKDPRLPEELWPAQWPGARAHDVFVALHRDWGWAAREHVSRVLGQQVPDPDVQPRSVDPVPVL